MSVALMPEALQAFSLNRSEEPGAFFNGKKIQVEGVARKVRINFYANGKKTNAHYFQTHVYVTDIAKVMFIA